jgi:hypothetical protein
MVQGREDLGLAPKACEAVSVLRERGRQDLQRDIAAEPGVTGAIDLAHAAPSDQANNVIRTEVASST